MTLGHLIRELEARPQDRAVAVGFGNPHSYRGDYSELAFEPVHSTTIGQMLAAAREALGATYQGYKGGYYTMSEYTPCWLAMEGHSDGEGIGPVLIDFMCGPKPEAQAAKPCPFCGGLAVTVCYIADDETYAVCSGCGATGPDSASGDEAIERWDRRVGNV